MRPGGQRVIRVLDRSPSIRRSTMRIVYAFRRSALYPDPGREAELPPKEARVPFLRRVKESGFEGLELAVPRAGEAEARELRRELEDAGLPCAAVRGGGASLRPQEI